MAEEQEQRAWNRLDDRTRNVLQVIATQIAVFHEQGRTGTLRFDADFDQGVIPEDGFHQNIHEKVL